MNRAKISIIMAAVIAIASVGCGKSISSVTPVLQVTSLTDAAGTGIPISSTTVVPEITDPSSFNLVFSQPMMVNTVTAEGSVTLVCGGASAAITVALSPTNASVNGIDNNGFLITVTDPAQYDNTACTFTFTQNIANYLNGHMAQATADFTILMPN